MFERTANPRVLTSHNNPFFRYVPVTPPRNDLSASPCDEETSSLLPHPLGGNPLVDVDVEAGEGRRKDRALTGQEDGARGSGVHVPNQENEPQPMIAAMAPPRAHARVCHA
ncbi:hypothetical protein Pelo_19630 [Pelomyxa schiedti]|nr:hypothetical protein Pelo_19630 [Pelomyxa schiedti]